MICFTFPSTIPASRYGLQVWSPYQSSYSTKHCNLQAHRWWGKFRVMGLQDLWGQLLCPGGRLVRAESGHSLWGLLLPALPLYPSACLRDKQKLDLGKVVLKVFWMNEWMNEWRFHFLIEQMNSPLFSLCFNCSQNGDFLFCLSKI